jgi:predicted ArsR family transcriptional regulator
MLIFAALDVPKSANELAAELKLPIKRVRDSLLAMVCRDAVHVAYRKQLGGGYPTSFYGRFADTAEGRGSGEIALPPGLPRPASVFHLGAILVANQDAWNQVNETFKEAA